MKVAIQLQKECFEAHARDEQGLTCFWQDLMQAAFASGASLQQAASFHFSFIFAPIKFMVVFNIPFQFISGVLGCACR
jgi:hypothetical protein